MGAGQPDKSRLSWAFDGAVAIVGVLIGVVVLARLLTSDHFDTHWAVALPAGAAIAAVMSRFPLILNRSSPGIEVGFDSAVLVFLAFFDGGEGALAVWVVAQVLSQATTSKRLDVRLFNIGLGVIAGAAALAVMTSLSDLDRTEPRNLLSVAAGCAAYFLVDYFCSAISVTLEERGSLRRVLADNAGPISFSVLLAIDSLGYLAALVVRDLPAWSAGLLAVPLLTILVATRALSRAHEHRRRLEALFDAAAEAQVAESAEQLRELLVRHARAALAHREAGLRPEAPRQSEVGAPVRVGGDVLWLTLPARHRARATVEADRKALEALATVAEEAFARVALTAEMGHLARHDPLTALPNRAFFLDRVEEAVRRAHRNGGTLAVLFLDLDGFKGVNDRFGHAEGDALLKIVAGRLRDCVRSSDIVARLGGDEFAVLVEGFGHVIELETLCRRILCALREEITIMGHDVVVGTSIGVAVADPDDDADGLLRNADMAMYRAKGQGKHRFFVYQSALREENIRRLELVEALRRAMHGELVVHYQPVVDLVRGRIDGLEALVRWRRDGRLVPPDEFITAAEESGLITELGERVLAQVVADAPVLTAAAGRPINLGINVSAHQLRDARFVALVGAAIDALEGNRLVLEMTETVVVANDAPTRQVLHALKDQGAILAIDDFGIGFSSIGYLRQLPVDILKIDRSFTGELDTSERSSALVEAILVMGTALDLQVVAEGIERAAQMDRLRGLGCTVGQGYLFGRPMPGEEAARLLARPLPAGLWAAGRSVASF